MTQKNGETRLLKLVHGDYIYFLICDNRLIGVMEASQDCSGTHFCR